MEKKIYTESTWDNETLREVLSGLDEEGYFLQEKERFIWEEEDVEEGYLDSCGMEKMINQAICEARTCLYHRNYGEAAEFYHILLDLEVPVYTEQGDKLESLDLQEVLRKKIVNVNEYELFGSILYAEYQILNRRWLVQGIYELIKDYPFLKQVNIGEIANLGYEYPADLEGFWNDWISFLEQQEGKLAFGLWRDALVYHLSDEDLLEVARNRWEEYPFFYMDCVKRFLRTSQYEKAVEAGMEALRTLPKNWRIRGRIAKLAARAAWERIDSESVYTLWYAACESDMTDGNMLQLSANAEFFESRRDSLEEIVNRLAVYPWLDAAEYEDKAENVLDERRKRRLQFLLGRFDVMKQDWMWYEKRGDLMGDAARDAIGFMLLYLYEGENLTEELLEIAKNINEILNLEGNEELYMVENVYNPIFWSLFSMWKKNYPMPMEEKYANLSWFEHRIGYQNEAEWIDWRKAIEQVRQSLERKKRVHKIFAF